MTATTNRAVIVMAVVTVLSWTIACNKTPAPENANGSVSNTAAPIPAGNQPDAAKPAASAPSAGGSLATPTETYKTGYAARKNKNLADLRRVLSRDALGFLADIGKEEKKTLDDQLRELAERPQGASDETRNEKMDGNRASLEYLSEKGDWVSMQFVKEGNDWKIDLPKGP